MVEEVLPLSGMKTGGRARVVRLNTEGAMRRRLLDLGLVEGTTVECLHRSMWGDPAAYQIRGAVIALRRSDGDGILVSALPEPEGGKRHG